MMRRALAHDEATLDPNGRALALRATLRAAYRLQRRLGELDALFRDLEELKLSTIAAIIEETALDPKEAAGYLAHIASRPIGHALADLQGPLLTIALGLIGMHADDELKQPSKRSAKPPSWEELNTRRFQVATGWLGWTPAAAWRSSPAEIDEAFEGYVDKMKTLNGTVEKPKDERTLADKFRAVFTNRAGEPA